MTLGIVNITRRLKEASPRIRFSWPRKRYHRARTPRERLIDADLSNETPRLARIRAESRARRHFAPARTLAILVLGAASLVLVTTLPALAIVSAVAAAALIVTTGRRAVATG